MTPSRLAADSAGDDRHYLILGVAALLALVFSVGAKAVFGFQHAYFLFNSLITQAVVCSAGISTGNRGKDRVARRDERVTGHGRLRP